MKGPYQMRKWESAGEEGRRGSGKKCQERSEGEDRSREKGKRERGRGKRCAVPANETWQST